MEMENKIVVMVAEQTAGIVCIAGSAIYAMQTYSQDMLCNNMQLRKGEPNGGE